MKFEFMEEKPGVPARLNGNEARKIIGEKVNIDQIENKLEKIREQMTNPLRDPFSFEGRETVKALARLVLELRDRIPSYETILSDDASGRLVSLLLYRIVNQKREELDKKRARIFFLATGEDYNSKDKDKTIHEFISRHKDKFGKTLLVTEYIQSGESIEELTKILEKEGIDFDLAAVSIEKPLDHYSDKDFVNHLRYGTVGSEGIRFYESYQTSGVKKGKMGPHPMKVGGAFPEDIEGARREINLVADELAKLVDVKDDKR